MKRVWIVCGILVAILALSCASLYHLVQATDDMSASLDQLAQAVEGYDDAQIERLTQEFQSKWEEHETLMMRYIHHDELDGITGSVARLGALARHRGYTELAAEVDRLRHLVRHIRDSEMPTLVNIF